MQARNLARVELEEDEFLELREQNSSVAREDCVRSHRSGMSAVRQKPSRDREWSDTNPLREHRVWMTDLVQALHMSSVTSAYRRPISIRGRRYSIYDARN